MLPTHLVSQAPIVATMPVSATAPGGGGGGGQVLYMKAPPPAVRAPTAPSTPANDSISSSPPAAPSANEMRPGPNRLRLHEYHERLVAIYRAHNPANISKVEYLLKKYQGHEEFLYQSVCTKYNVDPDKFALQTVPAEMLATQQKAHQQASGTTHRQVMAWDPSSGKMVATTVEMDEEEAPWSRRRRRAGRAGSTPTGRGAGQDAEEDDDYDPFSMAPAAQSKKRDWAKMAEIDSVLLGQRSGFFDSKLVKPAAVTAAQNGTAPTNGTAAGDQEGKGGAAGRPTKVVTDVGGDIQIIADDDIADAEQVVEGSDTEPEEETGGTDTAAVLSSLLGANASGNASANETESDSESDSKETVTDADDSASEARGDAAGDGEQAGAIIEVGDEELELQLRRQVEQMERRLGDAEERDSDIAPGTRNEVASDRAQMEHNAGELKALTKEARKDDADEEPAADAVLRALRQAVRDAPSSQRMPSSAVTAAAAVRIEPNAGEIEGATAEATAQAAATSSDYARTRGEMASAIFAALDSGGTGRLRCPEMQKFSRLIGWEGDDQEWKEEYETLCEEWECLDSDGFNEASFSDIINDKSDKGLYCSDRELKGIWLQVAAPTTVPGAKPDKRAAAAIRERSRSRSRRDPRHK